jgi:hypothetical protein
MREAYSRGKLFAEKAGEVEEAKEAYEVLEAHLFSLFGLFPLSNLPSPGPFPLRKHDRNVNYI